MSRVVEVVRTFVEMRSPGALRPVPCPLPQARVEQVARCSAAVYRALYAGVGAAYHWHDRDAWSDDTLARYLAGGDVTVLVLRVAHELAGYAELRTHEDTSVEIAYFGLMPGFVGRGLGGFLLTEAVREAWRMRTPSGAGPPRVWLHTCTLDSPAALPNYRARGFTPYAEETYTVTLPAVAPAP